VDRGGEEDGEVEVPSEWEEEEGRGVGGRAEEKWSCQGGQGGGMGGGSRSRGARGEGCYGRLGDGWRDGGG